jgi:hypothetical protein
MTESSHVRNIEYTERKRLKDADEYEPDDYQSKKQSQTSSTDLLIHNKCTKTGEVVQKSQQCYYMHSLPLQKIQLKIHTNFPFRIILRNGSQNHRNKLVIESLHQLAISRAHDKINCLP